MITIPGRHPRSLFPMLLLLSLAGSCRHVPDLAQQATAHVGYADIVPPMATELVLAPNQTFALGEPIPSVTMPGYPAALLSSGLDDQDVCVSVVVDAEGSVTSVTPLFAIPDCPLGESETNREFVAAVVDAVEKWEFYSSQICTFPTGSQPGSRCSGTGVEIVPVSVTQSFQFHFSIQDGVGTVLRASRGSQAPDGR